MWLRHFLHKRRQKRFKAFKKRYYEYRESDTSELCIYHHEEISSQNWVLIGNWVRKHKKPCKDYTWKEAELLMKHLRLYYATWVKRPTPGLEPRPRTFGIQSVSR